MRCWMKKKDAVLTLQTHCRSLALPIDSERRISPRDNQIQIGKCAMVLIASAETSLSSNLWVVSSVQLCKQYIIEKFLPWRTSAIACLLQFQWMCKKLSWRQATPHVCLRMKQTDACKRSVLLFMTVKTRPFGWNRLLMCPWFAWNKIKSQMPKTLPFTLWNYCSLYTKHVEILIYKWPPGS